MNTQAHTSVANRKNESLKSFSKEQKREVWLKTTQQVVSQELDPYNLGVYLAISTFINEEGICWPSYETIATKSSIGKTKVIESVRELRKKGLIKVENRKKRDGSYNSNLISLVPFFDLQAGHKVEQRVDQIEDSISSGYLNQKKSKHLQVKDEEVSQSQIEKRLDRIEQMLLRLGAGQEQVESSAARSQDVERLEKKIELLLEAKTKEQFQRLETFMQSFKMMLIQLAALISPSILQQILSSLEEGGRRVERSEGSVKQSVDTSYLSRGCSPNGQGQDYTASKPPTLQDIDNKSFTTSIQCRETVSPMSPDGQKHDLRTYRTIEEKSVERVSSDLSSMSQSSEQKHISSLSLHSSLSISSVGKEQEKQSSSTSSFTSTTNTSTTDSSTSSYQPYIELQDWMVSWAEKVNPGVDVYEATFKLNEWFKSPSMASRFNDSQKVLSKWKDWITNEGLFTRSRERRLHQLKASDDLQAAPQATTAVSSSQPASASKDSRPSAASSKASGDEARPSSEHQASRPNYKSKEYTNFLLKVGSEQVVMKDSELDKLRLEIERANLIEKLQQDLWNELDDDKKLSLITDKQKQLLSSKHQYLYIRMVDDEFRKKAIYEIQKDLSNDYLNSHPEIVSVGTALAS